jgi:tetratricopeptide (TPR) repeat protein
VSKKHKHHAQASSPADLRPRIERARQEGRFQQALELAKQLHKYEPTPAHRDLLRDVYLGRARQLRGQGQLRDALTVLEASLRIDSETPAWLEQVAEEMARCGDPRQALALLERVPGAAGAGRVQASAVDAALQQGPAGRAGLPPALQADLDRILQAFHESGAGRDEAARETLAGIGLRSPFLEWKVFLRGLQAYYQNDDTRALENWQRLNPERVPARLAAPLRFQIDAGYRAAQPAAAQAALQKHLDQLQGSPLLGALRALRAALANKRQTASAFRQAQDLLPAVRQQASHLLPRLASCFYWAVLEGGPDDVLRYQRVFGAPSDDPHFYRLHALAYEKADALAEAHRYWQKYEAEIAACPERWPPGQADRARALIWYRMGENAASIPEPRRRKRRSDSFFDDEDLKPLDPPAEKCFQRSLELAPDQLEAHQALVRHHLEAGRAGKAEKAARQLLQHAPDHVPTLELLSDLRLKKNDYEEALALAQQALRANALDRRLRRKVGHAHLHHARSLVEAGRLDEARQEYQSALALSDATDGSVVLARWAALEFKAADAPRAEELLRQAQAQAPAAVGVAYLLLTEVIRLKLDRPLKVRFDQEFKEGLGGAPAAGAAAYLARIVAGLHAGGVRYTGQKTHRQKILSYIHKSRKADFTEAQLEEMCQALLELKAFAPARRFGQLGEAKFEQNPAFPYYQALSYLLGGGRRSNHWLIARLLQQARRLALAQPPGERRDRLLEEIEDRLHEVHPFDFDILGGIFDMGSPFEEDEGDFEDEYGPF